MQHRFRKMENTGEIASKMSNFFTCGFSPGLRTQLVQWKNSDYLLFPHEVHQPKNVEARLPKNFQPLVQCKNSDYLLFSNKVHQPTPKSDPFMV